jgi:hypothetical protein
MEKQNQEPSHLPLILLIYVPILLFLIHRLNLMQIGFARILCHFVMGVYFVIPAALLFVVLGELLNLRKIEGLKIIFPKEKPTLKWLLYELICFVILPTGAWMIWH